MAGTDFFRIERHGPVAHVAMNRPASANAMDPDFWDGLPAVMASLDGDTSVRACVISGEGRHFSGGMDLAVIAGMKEAAGDDPARGLFEGIMAMRGLLRKIERAGMDPKTLPLDGRRMFWGGFKPIVQLGS